MILASNGESRVNYGIATESVTLPFYLLGFNRIAWVALPGEIFCEFSQTIRQSFPEERIIVGSMVDTNTPGYVPTMESFPYGGYEVSCATLPPGSGEKMAQIAGKMLKTFYRRD